MREGQKRPDVLIALGIRQKVPRAFRLFRGGGVGKACMKDAGKSETSVGCSLKLILPLSLDRDLRLGHERSFSAYTVFRLSRLPNF